MSDYAGIRRGALTGTLAVMVFSVPMSAAVSGHGTDRHVAAVSQVDIDNGAFTPEDLFEVGDFTFES